MNFQFTASEAASSSPLSSPSDSTRRHTQYKSRLSSSSVTSSRSRSMPQGSHNLNLRPQKEEDMWKVQLRQAMLARQKKERQDRQERARSSEPSSDASGDVDDDMDEDNEDPLNDEIYRRVMVNERHRMVHQAKVDYERTFGDSDDVLMGDVEEYEAQFRADSSQQNAAIPDANFIPPSQELMVEEDTEKLYQAYLADLQVQAEEEDEFEKEFEDIDPQTLVKMLGGVNK